MLAHRHIKGQPIVGPPGARADWLEAPLAAFTSPSLPKPGAREAGGPWRLESASPVDQDSHVAPLLTASRVALRLDKAAAAAQGALAVGECEPGLRSPPTTHARASDRGSAALGPRRPSSALETRSVSAETPPLPDLAGWEAKCARTWLRALEQLFGSAGAEPLAPVLQGLVSCRPEVPRLGPLVADGVAADKSMEVV